MAQTGFGPRHYILVDGGSMKPACDLAQLIREHFQKWKLEHPQEAAKIQEMANSLVKNPH